MVSVFSRRNPQPAGCGYREGRASRNWAIGQAILFGAAEEDFAGAGGLLGAGDGGGDFGEGVGGVDGGVEDALFDEGEELGEEGGAGVGGGALEPARDPEAAPGDVLENEEAIRDAQGLAGHGAVG